jgi:hypothetical protein
MLSSVARSSRGVHEARYGTQAAKRFDRAGVLSLAIGAICAISNYSTTTWTMHACY